MQNPLNLTEAEQREAQLYWDETVALQQSDEYAKLNEELNNVVPITDEEQAKFDKNLQNLRDAHGTPCTCKEDMAAYVEEHGSEDVGPHMCFHRRVILHVSHEGRVVERSMSEARAERERIQREIEEDGSLDSILKEAGIERRV